MSRKTLFSMKVPTSRPLSDHIIRVHSNFADLCNEVEKAYISEKGKKPSRPNITFGITKKLGGNGSVKEILKEMW